MIPLLLVQQRHSSNMDETTEQTTGEQNTNATPDVNALISAQNVKFDHLTEVLRNTLNDFGQSLGKHLGDLFSKQDSTTEPPAKRQKVHAAYDYDAESPSQHDQAYEGYQAPEDPKGNRSDSSATDEPEDLERNRPSEARGWKGKASNPQKGKAQKSAKGKNYVGPALAGQPALDNNNDGYNYASDVSVHASGNESAHDPDADDMHSIIYKSDRITSTDKDDESQVPQLFTTLAKDTKKASAVNDKLASSLELVWNKQQSKEHIKDILDKQLIPENCTFLQIPRVNPEIFASISQQAQGHDVKLQRHEKMLVKTAVPVAQLIDKLMHIKVDQKMTEELLVSLKGSASEVFTILSYADSELLQTRRDDIAPSLAKEYKQLRNDVKKGSDQLFGKNVTERIASISKANKATKALTVSASSKQGPSRPTKRKYNTESRGSKNLKSFPKHQKGSAGKKTNSGQKNHYKGYQRWNHQD